MPADHQIIIRRRRPGFTAAVIAGGVAALILGAWGFYRFTRAQTIGQFQHAVSERDQLLEERREQDRHLRDLAAENDRLKDRLAYQQQSGQIDETACGLVKKSLADLQTEASNLREQLAFYRGIVAPKESEAGLRVYDFAVRPGQAAGRFQYDLLLIQAFHHDRKVSGEATVSIEGLRGSQTLSYSLADLASGESRNLLFSFTYFQELDGVFQLPAGFRPLRVKVSLHPEGGSGPNVEDTYDWMKIEQQKGVS